MVVVGQCRSHRRNTHKQDTYGGRAATVVVLTESSVVYRFALPSGGRVTGAGGEPVTCVLEDEAVLE